MKPLRKKPNWSAIFVFGFLVALTLFFFVSGILQYYIHNFSISALIGIISGFVGAGIMAIYLRPSRDITPNVVNKLAIIGMVKEITHTKSENEIGREIVRIDVMPRIVDFNEDLLKPKAHNKNIAVIGMAGSGKTELTYFIISQMKYHKIIFQYKNSDRYRELGYPVLFLKKYSPNVFSDPESFTQAWLTAFSVENRGITASQVEPIIRDIASKVKDWKEFRAEAQERAKKEQGTITGNALNDILLKLQTVYSENQYNISIPSDIVIDFEGLNEQAFVFFAEYLLRELYEEIKSGKRTKTMIFVDEAHRFVKSSNTIIPELSAIIRSRGAFLFGTQRTSTIAGDVKGNAGTQFCFKQTEKEDLDQIRALSEPYQWIVERLYPYEFVDLAQQDSHKGIYIYRLINPKPDFKPVVEWQPDVRQEEKQKNTEDDSEGKGSSNIDIPSEIMRMLSQPANQQDLAKRFAKEYGNDPNYWKMTLKGYLKNIVMNNEISADITDYVKFDDNGKAYEIRNSIIYHRKANYDYHDWLVEMTAEILYHKGLSPQIQAHGLPLADILVENPKKLAFEIETGSKNGYKINETKQRIADFQKQGYKIYVIVPNQEVKKRYAEAGFSEIFTPLELWEVEI